MAEREKERAVGEMGSKDKLHLLQVLDEPISNAGQCVAPEIKRYIKNIK